MRKELVFNLLEKNDDPQTLLIVVSYISITYTGYNLMNSLIEITYFADSQNNMNELIINIHSTSPLCQKRPRLTQYEIVI